MGKRPRLPVVSLAAALVLLLAVGCDEATPPQPAGWVRIASFPETAESVNALALHSSSLYAAVTASSRDHALILKYDFHKYEQVYTTEAYPYAALAALSFDYTGPDAWAAGYKIPAGAYEPLLVRYSHHEDLWEEVPLNVTGGQILTDVVAVGENSCFLLQNSNANPKKVGFLIKYNEGDVKYYPAYGCVSASYAYPSAAPHRFYCVSYEPVATSAGKGVRIYSTGDDGASWLEETCPAATFGGRRPVSAQARAWFGQTLYFTVAFDDGATGVVSRAGHPGSAVYTLVFVSYAGPYFTDLAGLAFRVGISEDSGVMSDGVGVGTNTAICFNGDDVTIEKLPYRLTLTALCRAGGNGFWAAGNNGATSGCDLLFHP
jgi:hypothetical protein